MQLCNIIVFFFHRGACPIFWGTKNFVLKNIPCALAVLYRVVPKPFKKHLEIMKPLQIKTLT